jgi:hypothetical protein
MPGTVRVGLVVLSTLLSAASTVPYLVATAKRQTQPRVVTWLTWALLTAVGGAASASVGDYPSAAFSFIGTLVTSAVVVAGLRYGDRAFGRLDIACFVLVVAGFGLWLILDVPGIAVGAACVIDFIGLVPTLAHAWRSPHEETAVTYALIAVGGGAATAAAWGTWTVTAVAYPLYVLVSMAACWAIVVGRGARLRVATERELSGLAFGPAERTGSLSADREGAEAEGADPEGAEPDEPSAEPAAVEAVVVEPAVTRSAVVEAGAETTT